MACLPEVEPELVAFGEDHTGVHHAMAAAGAAPSKSVTFEFDGFSEKLSHIKVKKYCPTWTPFGCSFRFPQTLQCMAVMVLFVEKVLRMSP